jgi:hypothetical protein
MLLIEPARCRRNAALAEINHDDFSRSRSGEQQGDPPAAATSFREGGSPIVEGTDTLKSNQSNLGDTDVKYLL